MENKQTHPEMPPEEIPGGTGPTKMALEKGGKSIRTQQPYSKPHLLLESHGEFILPIIFYLVRIILNCPLRTSCGMKYWHLLLQHLSVESY